MRLREGVLCKNLVGIILALSPLLIYVPSSVTKDVHFTLLVTIRSSKCCEDSELLGTIMRFY